MKKTFKVAVAASVLASPAMAYVPGQMYSTVNNMENPLYLPTKHEFYSKLSNSVMLKVADDTVAHKKKNHDGDVEFPIIRIQEEMGFGLTDRWALNFAVQYTHDNDIGRTGLSDGRLGTTYRLFTPENNNGWTWDAYGDLRLGGIGEMRGQYNVTITNPKTMAIDGIFDYDNYSDGMWGVHVGTKFGRVWNERFTTSAFVEYMRSFGADNNTIRVVGDNTAIMPPLTLSDLGSVNISSATLLAAKGVPSTIVADLKDKEELSLGANAFYHWTEKLTSGIWFRYNHRDDAGVDKIKTNLGGLEGMKPVLEKMLSDMEDGFDEYIVGLSLAHQFTEHAQVALYGEYTFDTAHKNSQNGTDVKAEMGVRVNFKF